MKYKPGTNVNTKITMTTAQLVAYMQWYASYMCVVDPNGVYEFETNCVYPADENGYIHNLKFQRTDRAIRA